MGVVPIAGCGTIASKARVNPSTVASYTPADPKYQFVSGLGEVSRAEAINLDCFTLPGGGNAYQAALKARVDRNRLEAALLKHADDICLTEKGRMVGYEAATNTSLSFVSTALATASSIVGGEQAKSILAGGSALAGATRENVNANVYRNQLIQAITKAIDGERGAILKQLIAQRPADDKDYSVDEMIRLVNTYHQACSFEKGIQLVLDAAVNREGVNAIIQERNLSARISDLRREIDAAAKRANGGDNEAKKTADELEKKLRELMLQRATLAQQTEGVNVAGD